MLWTLQISLLRTFPDPRDCSTEDLAAFITKPLQSPCRSTPEGSTGICICTLSSCLRPLPPPPLPEPLQPALPGTGYGPWCSLCDSSCHVCACQSRPPLPCMCPHCHANVICPKPASGLYKKGLYKKRAPVLGLCFGETVRGSPQLCPSSVDKELWAEEIFPPQPHVCLSRDIPDT